MREPLPVFLIHLLEIRHIIQEYTNPDNLTHLGSASLEDGLDVFTALGCLLADGTLNQGTLLVGWELAGYPDLVGGLDGL